MAGGRQAERASTALAPRPACGAACCGCKRGGRRKRSRRKRGSSLRGGAKAARGVGSLSVENSAFVGFSTDRGSGRGSEGAPVCLKPCVRGLSDRQDGRASIRWPVCLSFSPRSQAFRQTGILSAGFSTDRRPRVCQKPCARRFRFRKAEAFRHAFDDLVVVGWKRRNGKGEALPAQARHRFVRAARRRKGRRHRPRAPPQYARGSPSWGSRCPTRCAKASPGRARSCRRSAAERTRESL